MEWIIFTICSILALSWTYGIRIATPETNLNVGMPAITAWWWLSLILSLLLSINFLHLLWIFPCIVAVIFIHTFLFVFLMGTAPGYILALIILGPGKLLFRVVNAYTKQRLRNNGQLASKTK